MSYRRVKQIERKPTTKQIYNTHQLVQHTTWP